MKIGLFSTLCIDQEIIGASRYDIRYICPKNEREVIHVEINYTGIQPIHQRKGYSKLIKSGIENNISNIRTSRKKIAKAEI